MNADEKTAQLIVSGPHGIVMVDLHSRPDSPVRNTLVKSLPQDYFRVDRGNYYLPVDVAMDEDGVGYMMWANFHRLNGNRCE